LGYLEQIWSSHVVTKWRSRPLRQERGPAARAPNPASPAAAVGGSALALADSLSIAAEELAGVGDLSDIDWFWTCSGQALVYRDADALFSCEGRQIGQFEGDEVYGCQGNYLGEIARTGRLITQLSKLKWRRSGFSPSSGRSFDPPPDALAERISAGFRDFKLPG